MRVAALAAAAAAGAAWGAQACSDIGGTYNSSDHVQHVVEARQTVCTVLLRVEGEPSLVGTMVGSRLYIPGWVVGHVEDSGDLTFLGDGRTWTRIDPPLQTGATASGTTATATTTWTSGTIFTAWPPSPTAECAPGAVAAAGVDTAVRHPAIPDGEAKDVPCPDGYSGAVALLCTTGNVSVEAVQCQALCKEAEVMVGDHLVKHPDMAEGTTTEYPDFCDKCQTGALILNCTATGVRASSTCRLSGECCAPGELLGDNASLAYPMLEDGDIYLATCTGGYVGTVSLRCSSSVVSQANASESCSPACPAGLVDAGGTSVPFPDMGLGQVSAADCPSENHTGHLELSCVDGGIVEVNGSCFASCEAAELPGGRGAPSLALPAGLNGQVALAQCPSGGGSVPMRCNDGVYETACDEADGDSGGSCTCDPEEGQRLPGGAHSAIFAACLVLGALLGLAAAFAVAALLRRRRGAAPHGLLHIASGTSSTPGEDDDLEAAVGPGPPRPCYWSTLGGVHLLPDPGRMRQMQVLMGDTWAERSTRDRRIVAGDLRVPAGCRVASVLRVENHSAWERYCRYRGGVAGRRGGACTAFPALTQGRLGALDGRVNEMYLFHGTNPEAADAIARCGSFSMDRAGTCRGSMLGAGIYLAENSSKSDEYAKEGEGVYVDLCAMLVCRAVAGEVSTVTTTGDHSSKVHSGSYDAVCGDRLAAAGTYREVVFFNEEAVYPEFVVIYSRVYDKRTPPKAVGSAHARAESADGVPAAAGKVWPPGRARSLSESSCSL